MQVPHRNNAVRVVRRGGILVVSGNSQLRELNVSWRTTWVKNDN